MYWIDTIKSWEKHGLKYNIVLKEHPGPVKALAPSLRDEYFGNVRFPKCPMTEEGHELVSLRDVKVPGGIVRSGWISDGWYTYGFICTEDQFHGLDWLTQECESMGRQIVDLAARKQEGE